MYRHAEGRWIICGFGRFGRNVGRQLEAAGTPITVIDPEPKNTLDLPHAVVGVGTEAVTLREAGVEEAVGIVAGTANDADNLSIIMTARQLNPKLITVVRQNLRANELVFANSHCDFIMQPGLIIATRILAQLKTPLLSVFIDQLMQQDEVWAHTLVNRMSAMVGDEKLETRSLRIDPREAPAVHARLEEGEAIKLLTLIKNPHDPRETLRCFPLMLRRGGEVHLLPGELTLLEPEDELLFCGLERELKRMEWTVYNHSTLHYMLTGLELTESRLRKWLRGSGDNS